MATPAINSRWYLLHHWTVLVWLDRMDEIHPLDGTNCERSHYWLRNIRNLPAVFQLPDRLVSHLVRFVSLYSELHATNNLSSAASMFAANTIIRSAVGAAFSLFSKQMFNNLRVQWAGTLLGCLALIMVPIPLAFIKIGPILRKKSKFAPTFGPCESITPEKERRTSVSGLAARWEP